MACATAPPECWFPKPRSNFSLLTGACREHDPSFKEVGVSAGDALPERLELEPAREVRADQSIGILRGFVGNSLRLACGFREKLRLAGAVHGDEPPGSFVNAVANGKKAVIPQDGCLFGAKSASDSVAFGSVLDNAGVIIEDRMIFVKRTGILCDRIQAAAEGRPRFAVKRMRVRCGDNVGARGVNARVNGKRGEIDFGVAFDNRAGVIHQNQIGNPNPAEVQTEGIDPKTIKPLGIARGNVAGDAFIKTKFSEEPKGSSEAFFAMTALLGGRSKNGRARDTLHECVVRLRRRYRLRHEDLHGNEGGGRNCASTKSSWEEK